MRLRRVIVCLGALTFVVGAGEPSYDRDVRPVFAKNCTSCHQGASRSSGLDLTTYRGFKQGGNRGAAFVEGSPDESLTIKFLNGVMNPSMPLADPLLAGRDIETIREWIKAGAKDDTPAAVTSTQPTVYHSPPVITSLRFSPDGKLLAVGGNREVLLHHADGS